MALVLVPPPPDNAAVAVTVVEPRTEGRHVQVATNGELADDEGTAPMEVVDEVEDTEEVEPTQDVVAAEPILQSDEVKPKARRRRRQD